MIEGTWRFQRGDIAVDSWEAVAIPLTWNAKDGDDGGGDYYHGPGWYEKLLAPPSRTPGARVFIRFESASIVSDV